MAAIKTLRRSSFKFPIYFMPDVFGSAYPFHMAQGMRAMRGLVNNCDCVIEVRDARVPLSSSNPQFSDLFANKDKILLMNKIDLADESLTKDLCEERLSKDYTKIIYNNCKSQSNDQFKKVMTSLKEIFMKVNQEKATKQILKPVKSLNDREYKIMVCGIPNVGKSSFINAARRHYMARGGKASPVGKKPGVTRSVLQSINISQKPKIKILDSPGIIPPYINDPITGIKLALTGTFPDHLIGEEIIADYLLYKLNETLNYSYVEYCGLNEPSDVFDNVIGALAEKRNLYKDKDVPDYRRCSIVLINAYRNLNFGLTTLD